MAHTRQPQIAKSKAARPQIARRIGHRHDIEIELSLVETHAGDIVQEFDLNVGGVVLEV
jgi:hypothetical protein